MSDTLVVDPSGRVYIPKLLRKLLGLEPYSLMEVAVDADKVVLKKVASVADFGRGRYRRGDIDDPVDALGRAASD